MMVSIYINNYYIQQGLTHLPTLSKKTHFLKNSFCRLSLAEHPSLLKRFKTNTKPSNKQKVLARTWANEELYGDK